MGLTIIPHYDLEGETKFRRKKKMTEELLEVYRHSLAHILAKAVIEMFGKDNVQYAIGPQIADGCYYDFTLPRPITEDDYRAY